MNPNGAQRLGAGLLFLLLSTSCGGGGSQSTPLTPAPSPVDPGITDPTPALPDPPPGPEAPSERLISGSVGTPQGLPVPGAVVLTDSGFSSLTDAEGQFDLGAQPPGTATLRIEASGFVAGTVVVPAGTDPAILEITIAPLPVEDVEGVALQAEAGLGGTTLGIPVPGINLPYDYFIYRRPTDGAFDWNSPLNSEPLRQVEIEPNGHASTLVSGPTLYYRDSTLVGGTDYSYTVRLRDLDGQFGPPQGETPSTGAGFGPATILDAGPDEVLLDTAPGADGTLVGLYRDLSYQPWHRFIARRFDGAGNVAEIFRSEGVYDEAEVFVDRLDIPYFLYRRNGIEFLFETFLMNFYDAYGLSQDVHIGQSYRKITGELSAGLRFRPDPEGIAAEELVAVYVNRDRQVVAQRWDYGTNLSHHEQILGAADSTMQPRLRTIMNRAGDVAAFWNRDFSDSAFWQLAFYTGGTVGPERTLGTGQSMAIAAGLSADDQFVFAVTREPFATTLDFMRYQPDGSATAATTLALAVEGCALPADPGRMAIVSLPNGKTYFLGIVQSNTGVRELRAWDITDFEEILPLGVITLGPGSEVPLSLEVNLDYAGKVHIVTSESGHLKYRRFFWPE